MIPPRDHLLKQIDTALGWLKNGSIRDLEIYAVLSHCSEYLTLDATEIEQLRTGLQDAVETIHVWHGDVAWEIYRDNAPEMKRISAVLSPTNTKGNP